MNDSLRSPDHESGMTLLRGVVVIVLAGIALGLGSNQIQKLSGSSRALPLIAKESKLARLEDLPAVSPGVAATAPGAAKEATAPGAVAPGGTGATTPGVAAPGTAAGAGRAAGQKRSETSANRPARALPPAASPAAAPSTAARLTDPGAPPPGAASAGSSAGRTPPPGAPSASSGPSSPATSLPAIPDTREPLEAGYATVKALHDVGAALFVDARSPEEFAAGHIPGAVNLPFDDVFKKPELARSLESRGRPIVTYCGGGDCELSKSLAFALIEAGQKKVLVFTTGLPGWKDAGNPVTTGAGP